MNAIVNRLLMLVLLLAASLYSTPELPALRSSSPLPALILGVGALIMLILGEILELLAKSKSRKPQ